MSSGVKQGILHSFSNLVKELEIKTIHSSWRPRKWSLTMPDKIINKVF